MGYSVPVSQLLRPCLHKEQMASVQKPDCRQCGLCCVSPYDQPVFADLVPADLKRMSPKWIKENIGESSTFDRILNGGIPGAIKTRWVKNKRGPLKGYEQCRCRALRGTTMVRVSCSIYAKRPRVCRIAVRPGDRTCLEIRKMYKELIEGREKTS
jgi:Fe-S-cluster containining protein